MVLQQMEGMLRGIAAEEAEYLANTEVRTIPVSDERLLELGLGDGEPP